MCFKGIPKGFSDCDEKSSQTPVSQRKCRSRPQSNKKDSPQTFAPENKENLVSRNSSRKVEKEKDSGKYKQVQLT